MTCPQTHMEQYIFIYTVYIYRVWYIDRWVCLCRCTPPLLSFPLLSINIYLKGNRFWKGQEALVKNLNMLNSFSSSLNGVVSQSGLLFKVKLRNVSEENFKLSFQTPLSQVWLLSEFNSNHMNHHSFCHTEDFFLFNLAMHSSSYGQTPLT